MQSLETGWQENIEKKDSRVVWNCKKKEKFPLNHQWRFSDKSTQVSKKDLKCQESPSVKETTTPQRFH